ncbi:MAG: hypothetical protein WKF75_17045 [Singulisphaera sp.]
MNWSPGAGGTTSGRPRGDRDRRVRVVETSWTGPGIELSCNREKTAGQAAALSSSLKVSGLLVCESVKVSAPIASPAFRPALAAGESGAIAAILGRTA